MSLNPNFKRRASDKNDTSGQNRGPRERRSRPRRKASEFSKEIEPLLNHVEPEVQEKIRALVKKGKSVEAKNELIEYLTKTDRAAMVQELIQIKVRPVERSMSWRVYILSIIPVLILIYCIACLLIKGHLELP